MVGAQRLGMSFFFRLVPIHDTVRIFCFDLMSIPVNGTAMYRILVLPRHVYS